MTCSVVITSSEPLKKPLPPTCIPSSPKPLVKSNLRRSVAFKTEMAYIDYLCQPMSDTQKKALRELELQEAKMFLRAQESKATVTE